MMLQTYQSKYMVETLKKGSHQHNNHCILKEDVKDTYKICQE
jgi:hypothetical protein